MGQFAKCNTAKCQYLSVVCSRILTTEYRLLRWTEDTKKLLIEHTKQVISRTEAARTFTCSLSSTSASTITGNSACSGEVPSQRQLSSSSSQLQPCQPQPSKKMKLLQKASQTAPAGTFSDNNLKIESEVNTYIHLETAEHEENPLVFWKKHEVNYPNLSVLAKCYLTISASSVPVEAMFSTSGLILNSKRSSMAPYRANMLSVVHDNYSKFFPTSRAAAAMSATSTDKNWTVC